MNITFTMIETVLLSAILVGCHSYSNPIASNDNPKASLLAEQRVRSEFSNASPQWAISKDCDPASPDFYVCFNYTNVFAYSSTFPTASPLPPTPRLFKTFSTATQSVTGTPDGNYLVKVRVDGVCAFSDAGNLLGRPFRCGGGDRQYQSVFDVKVHQQGVFGTDWSVVSVEEDPDIVQRRNEEERQAQAVQEAARRKVQVASDLENAVINSDYSATKIALESGADPNALLQSIGHPYPLYIAKTPELAKLLIEHGANVDGNGVCPICNAAVDSNIELFKVLYKAGASITLTGRFASVEQTLLDCHKIMNDRPSKDLPQCLQMEEIIRSGR